MKWKKAVLIILVFFIYSGVGKLHHQAYADEGDLILIPNEKYLFNISNMKPGDWAERSLTVKNGGEEDFNYTIKVNNKQRDQKLFNELELKVNTEGNSYNIFDDKLKKFSDFKPKQLKKGMADTLHFQVKMPFELGNDFQGTSAYFELSILVASDTGSSPSKDPD